MTDTVIRRERVSIGKLHISSVMHQSAYANVEFSSV